MAEQTGKDTESSIKRRIRISVRSLVEFMLRKGNIDDRIPAASEETMAEGARMHRRLQKAAGADYEAEVSLKTIYPLNERDEICIEGRADGIYYGAVPETYRPQLQESRNERRSEPRNESLNKLRNKSWNESESRNEEMEPGAEPGGDELWTVDEIKTTWRNVRKMKEPSPLHLAQAKCYAYIYACDYQLDRIRVRMTYCSLDDESLKYFYQEYTAEDLTVWFTELMEGYRRWAEFSLQWAELRDQTIHPLTLPFPWRKGQKELAVHVYHTICHQRKLFIEAPTGAGKTMAVLYPAIEALGQGKAERIFYLTAKNVAGSVAEDTVDLLRKSGLRLKNVTLTAKEKICPQEKISCRPDRCLRAKGHYDRVNEAMYALLTSEDRLDRERILACAQAFQVCPFELSLDLSLYADMIICDYNYVFDPHAYLRRFFGEGTRRGTAIFLIDEAHNLVDRGRDMYSAGLYREDIRRFRKKVRTVWPNLWKSLGKCLRAMKELEPESGEFEVLEDVDALAGTVYEAHAAIRRILNRERKRQLRRMEDRQGEENIHETRPAAIYSDTKLSLDLNLEPDANSDAAENPGLDLEAEDAAAEAPRDEDSGEEKGTVHEELLSFYFEISHFLLIHEGLDEHYVVYSERAGGAGHRIRLFCVDPGRNLRERMEQGTASILFSATLLPIRYFKQLLGGTEKDYEVYARSSFEPSHRGVFIADNVTSRYTARGPKMYEKIAEEIHRIVCCRRGNYLVFFPSYAFMREVDTAYKERQFAGKSGEPVILMQSESMTQEERETFLQRFGGRTRSAAAKLPDPDMNAAQRGVNPDIDVEQWTADSDIGALQRAADSGIGTEQQAANPAAGAARTDDGPGAETDTGIVGFCVLGGVFSEGIDLKEDALIGAIIVGTGIPQVSREREIMKSYFAAEGRNGFDYAYRFPGMNRVLQAAGRVIRTENDRGIVALLDERFTWDGYRLLFPAEWNRIGRIGGDRTEKNLLIFWNQYDKNM